MPVLLNEDYTYTLPKLYRVQQLFDRTSMKDVEDTLKRELEKEEIIKKIRPGDRVAVAVGSRGIKNLYQIVKTVLEDIIKKGGIPYIVSAMGSHGNGTEEGQREVLESYGITEENLGVKVVTTVDVNYLGVTPSGKKVYFDRAAMEADAIIPINRVKLHTDFVGDLQSGLCKMLVIGLGNQIGCSSIHEEDPDEFAAIIEDAARLILEKCKVAYGIATIENAYDETFMVEAVPADVLIEREKELVKIARTKMPLLIPPEIDVLVVEEIGKNISGAGYDPNILGKSSVLKQFCLPVPKIKRMVLLGVTPQSHGNAIGVGLFDVTVKEVFEQMDYEAMYANAIACRCIEDCRVPLVAADEDEAVRVAIKCIRNVEKEQLRIVKIKNTLELEYIEVSDAVLNDIREDERIRIV
ncbi:lactate racemase domain-containing protein [Clostridium transplantifaecale]|uniref:lactate racemase domain-containing protein n=1 Tax=Clostridium transplantifaecale TaxID=2479838 RepID=UPI000F637B34|nr:lactate racemase domain-containing protein [Clostridium transplantifaecale]